MPVCDGAEPKVFFENSDLFIGRSRIATPNAKIPEKFFGTKIHEVLQKPATRTEVSNPLGRAHSIEECFGRPLAHCTVTPLPIRRVGLLVGP